MKPRLLDLFCGAGGAAMGYARAGFNVCGVDVNPQPNYPFQFHQADALTITPEWIEDGDFDAIHASPPCQHFTMYRNIHKDITDRYEDLIAPTRDLLRATGLPYVIENVHGAPLLEAVILCGSQFDLDVQRHRLFETNWPLDAPWQPCRHKIWAADRFPGGASAPAAAKVTERTGRLIEKPSRYPTRRTVEVGTWDIPLDVQKRAMGVDWDVTTRELSEAIPPAYTEFIGAQLLDHIRAKAAA